MSDVFISYANADRPRARILVEALEKQGWSIWWDRTILPGKRWDRIIEEALNDARCVIVLWSENSIQSDWVRTEAEEAKRRGILVPVLLDRVNIPLAFRGIQAANLVDWPGALRPPEFDELVRAISGVLSNAAALAPQTARISPNVVPVIPIAPEISESERVKATNPGEQPMAPERGAAAISQAPGAVSAGAERLLEYREPADIHRPVEEDRAVPGRFETEQDAPQQAKPAGEPRVSRNARTSWLRLCVTGLAVLVPLLYLAWHNLIGPRQTPKNRRPLLSLSGNAQIWSVAWSPDGGRLATGTDAGVTLWDTVSGREMITLRGHKTSVVSVSWNPDGRRLGTTSWDNTVIVWDATSGKELLSLTCPGADKADSVAWSPGGERLVSAGGCVWDSNGRMLQTLKGRCRYSIAWSPDGAKLAGGSQDHTTGVWDAASGKRLLMLSGHSMDVTRVAWSPDGRRLASTSFDDTTKIWDSDSGTALLTLSVINGYRCVVWSPDGQKLATCSENNAVIWDGRGKELLRLSGHVGDVESAAWSPDGRRFATGSLDKTAKIWTAPAAQ